MYSNTHGVPSYLVSGVEGQEQFVISNREESRGDFKFDVAALEERVLLKVNAAGDALEMVTAATDQVFAVLVEPKEVGVDYFYALTDATVNREMVNFAAMGITEADLDQLQLTNSRIVYAKKIYGGLE